MCVCVCVCAIWKFFESGGNSEISDLQPNLEISEFAGVINLKISQFGGN